jgi:prepilin-type N-terminal cleavage/methylation domain-containing protein
LYATMIKSMSTIRYIQKGFTIVELLIVITIIVILASITLVVYGNIQNGGYDAAVQSDLDNTSGLLESFRVSTSATHYFPQSKTDLDPLNIKVSKNAYDTTTTVNFVYCVNNVDFQSYYIAALSKADTIFLMTQDGFVNNTILTKSSFSSSSSLCSSLGSNIGLVSGGMYAPNTWQTWTHS